MHANKNLHWAFTVFFCIGMIFSSALFVFDHEESINLFSGLGVPQQLIYPIIVFQILGVLVLLSDAPFVFKKWTKIGFMGILSFAMIAHLFAGDGQFILPLVGLLLLGGSYFFSRGEVLLPEGSPIEETV